jgi:ligand-binding sensor domain-containing protein
MPSDDVFDVFVDSKHRLWVSTEEGLVMFASTQGPYDVSKAKWFTGQQGIPNLRCRGITELHRKIFVATFGGGIGIGDSLAVQEGAQWKSVGATDGLASDRAYDVAADDSSIWIATSEGVSQYIDNEAIPLENRVVDHSSDSEFGGGIFTSVIVHNDNLRGPEIWVSETPTDSVGVSLGGGIRVLGEGGIQRFSTETSGIPSNSVNEVSYDPTRNLIWSAYPSDGAATVDVDSKIWTHYTDVDGLASNFGMSVAINPLNGGNWNAVGTVWIGTQDGVTRIESDGTFQAYGEGSGLPNVRVRKVYVDSSGNLWLGFVDSGAARVTGADDN